MQQGLAGQGSRAGNGKGWRERAEIVRSLSEGKVKRTTAFAQREVDAQPAATPYAARCRRLG